MDAALFSLDKYTKDNIRAIDARFEAQKIAFAPLTFQAVKALLDTGILKIIDDAGDKGCCTEEICNKTHISEYGVNVLCDMAVGMGVLKLTQEKRLVLGKVGWFLLNDDLTRANINFVNDICYKGAFYLKDSVESGKPEGLKEFGEQWNTIYEALSFLPEKERQSWFTFDHFYSDIAFKEVLPIVFSEKTLTLTDIGGNTAKWALACCKYNTDVKVTIVDLPGQIEEAAKNITKAGFSARINTQSGNVLSADIKLPVNQDAFWMSQFLDCFSLQQITHVLEKVHEAANKNTRVYVLEPLWDKQHFEGNAYSLLATSLYFTCMANGNSKMYRYGELVGAIEQAGFALESAWHNLGAHSYSLLLFKAA